MNTKRRAHCQLWHDWKERIIRIGDEQTSLQNQFDNFRNEIDDIDARLEGIETGDILLSQLVPDADKDMSGKRLYNVGIDANSVTAKNISADAVIIKDGGTVDGVDISTHSHDGTAIGGPKISYNNLTDKPTIPTKLSQLETDYNNQRVSAAEKAEWNRISTHTHDGTTVGGPKIPLSNVEVDADKDMGGKTLTNVGINANEVTIRGSQIEPTRINNHIVLWDSSEEIENESLKLTGGCTYIASTDSDNCPYPKYIHHEMGETGLIDYYPLDQPKTLIPVIPNSKIYLGMKYRKSDTEYINLHCRVYDRNKTFITTISRPTSTQSADNWRDFSKSITIPENGYYICPHIEIRPQVECDICGWKIWTDANFDSDLSAKNIAADGVVITDGGTVDGVDISTHTHDGTTVGGPKISYNDLVDKPQVDVSTHTHDGTAIGGPKISYNDLADKPTIPRPPMPFKKSVSINLASPGDYIDVPDTIPGGRTALTLERIRYRSIANILEGTGAFVVIGLIYDDNTVGTAIDRVTENGDTDWHPPTYYGLNQTFQFTKNYIKGIRIERTPGEGPPITGYVDIIGYVY